MNAIETLLLSYDDGGYTEYQEDARKEYAALKDRIEMLKQTNENWARAIETLEAENARLRAALKPLPPKGK